MSCYCCILVTVNVLLLLYFSGCECPIVVAATMVWAVTDENKDHAEGGAGKL